MTDLLFYGDTERSHAMRHELPVSIGDPFLLGIIGGRLHIMVSPLESSRIEAVAPDAVYHNLADLGFQELRESGLKMHELDLELVARAAAAMAVREAVVDPEMPVAVADRLRADGIVLRPDHDAIASRRRVKSRDELAGIRRAQAAAEAGLHAAADLLAQAVPAGEGLLHDGKPLTAEMVRAELREACRRGGAPAPPDVIVGSLWQGNGHDPGSGPLPADLPIVIDLWPQDEQSGCWADMTRTLVIREALERSRQAVRPGITGRELHAVACEVFELAGFATQRTNPGIDPEEGFQFSLGHGVGLAVHEDPALGQAGHDPLVAGDVIAVEPGLWQREVGEVRFEDLLLVTDEGCETLTNYPYELTP